MGVGLRLRVNKGPSEGVSRRCAMPCTGEEKGEEKISAGEEKGASGKISASLHNKQAQKVKEGGRRRGQGWG